MPDNREYTLFAVGLMLPVISFVDYLEILPEVPSALVVSKFGI